MLFPRCPAEGDMPKLKSWECPICVWTGQWVLRRASQTQQYTAHGTDVSWHHSFPFLHFPRCTSLTWRQQLACDWGLLGPLFSLKYFLFFPVSRWEIVTQHFLSLLLFLFSVCCQRTANLPSSRQPGSLVEQAGCCHGDSAVFPWRRGTGRVVAAAAAAEE